MHALFWNQLTFKINSHTGRLALMSAKIITLSSLYGPPRNKSLSNGETKQIFLHSFLKHRQPNFPAENGF